MPSEIQGKLCEVCGETAVWKSRLSPMGFIKCDRSKGYSHWLDYYYCDQHLHDTNDILWTKLNRFKIGRV